MHDDLELSAIGHHARQALTAVQLELHGAAAHSVPQRLRHVLAHREGVHGLGPPALAPIELAQPPQHGRRAYGFRAGLAQRGGEPLVDGPLWLAHELRRPHVGQERGHRLIQLVRERGGELAGHGEAHRALERRVLLADAPQRGVALGRESSEKERRNAEGEQRELHVEERNRPRSELERRDQRGLDQGNADHGARHSVPERDPGDRREERIEQVHVARRGEREDERHAGDRPEGLEDELAPVVPQPVPQRRAVDPDQQKRRERDDAAELADPVACDRRPRLAAVDLSGTHEDGDVARRSDTGGHRDRTREPGRRARCLDRLPEAAPPERPRRRGVDDRQVARGQRQHLPGRRPHVGPQLPHEDCEGEDGCPVHAARQQQCHEHSGIGIPGGDARVTEWLDVARPVEEPVQPQVGGAREPGLPPERTGGDPHSRCRGVIHAEGRPMPAAEAARRTLA